MHKLIRGLHEFQTTVFHSHRELFESLAQGQSPEALFITCSDSRINPNLLTQTRPGDLFIIRNAGNIIPPSSTAGGEAATVEYAVSVLGVNDIIVCGHTGCGALQAMLSPDKEAHLPYVSSWLVHVEATRRIMLQGYGQLPPDEQINVAAQENVLVQLAHLRTHPAVAAGLVAGTLQLHGWVYKIETGEVFAFDNHERQFKPISTARLPEAKDHRAPSQVI